MVKKVDSSTLRTGIDCACVIHGDVYSWEYVEKLYSALQRNFSVPVTLHVFTEQSRPVPAHMVKHALEDWPNIKGAKKAWWYKMQLFNQKHFQGQLLYFDLDVVITGSLDWILGLSSDYFWTIHDFRFLWKPNWTGMNSSVMYWDTSKWNQIWTDFAEKTVDNVSKQHPGDQDYIGSVITENHRRFFNKKFVKSWRWEVKDGGLDMTTRAYRKPNAGSSLLPETSIVVFHGNPKPHQIQDSVITTHWV